ncbi:hypothetical protein BaRGS_00031520, partial [Batillaria attramentaria]
MEKGKHRHAIEGPVRVCLKISLAASLCVYGLRMACWIDQQHRARQCLFVIKRLWPPDLNVVSG